MDNIMMEFVDVLRNNPDGAYDFISAHYYKFSKSELTDIIKELLYAIYDESRFGLLTEEDHDKILSNAANELEEAYKEEA